MEEQTPLDSAYLNAVLNANGIRPDEYQRRQLERFVELLAEWNARLNLVSRKDFPAIRRNHVLHSLAALTFMSFDEGCRIVDMGTGGGFPGLPLAILSPKSTFVLCDSIAKKIRAVEDIASRLRLENVECKLGRVETLASEPSMKRSVDFVLARAVSELPVLAHWGFPFLAKTGRRTLLAWKGGELMDELNSTRKLPFVSSLECREINLVNEEFFTREKKYIVEVLFHG